MNRGGEDKPDAVGPEAPGRQVPFHSKPKAKHVSARLIVRRVMDMAPDSQSELFTHFYHAVYTNSPLPMLEAHNGTPSARHRRAAHRRREETGRWPPSRVPRLTAEDWVRAALAAIADGGLAAVSVEPLARTLGATKGSFYWHFSNRDALVEAALLAWEAGETTEVDKMLAPLQEATTRLRVLLSAALGDRPGARVEAALLADAGVPQVRAILDRATRARTGYLRHLFEDLGVDSASQRATTTFALYLGLLHLRPAGSALAPHGEALDDYVEHLCAWLTDGAAPSGTNRRS